MLADLIARRRADRLPWLAIDAVSAPKVKRLPTDLIGLDLLFLNEDETAALLGGQRPPVVAAAALQAHGAKAVVLTCGLSGVIVADAGGAFALPALPVTTVANVTGAGDALVTADLHRLAGGDALLPAAKAGLVAAALALERQGGVRPDLSPVLLESAMHWAPSLPQDTR
jgi:pseudouridine kinase